MIPFVAKISVKNWRNHEFLLWIPLVFVWLLVLPVALLLLPVVFLVCLIARVRPLTALSVSWGILTATKGTEIQVNQPGTSISIHVF